MADTQKIKIYNTLSRTKEEFVPEIPNKLGLYVCGPTVYSDAHLGHARPAITFDLVYRYFSHLGYKVRYVRNITDVGHLSNELNDDGEDKIQKKAKLEELEPMEVVHQFTESYHKNMRELNVLSPNIEPRATGHIIEQQDTIQKILDKGYAYLSDGNVYFDVLKYNEQHNYGKLSGRKVEELFENTRQLDGQSEKKNSCDFALWKKASPKHIMRWKSPWSEGFPGWHVECSAMSEKYLGQKIDIHGGGMDLIFPHHEAEIAQSVATYGHETVKYWMHNNMITINGQKMGKSLGNFITLNELFSGEHKLLEKAYSPMTIRFFVLQAHYRSTLDFSNNALQAAEKGYLRLMNTWQKIDKISTSDKNTFEFDYQAFKQKCYDAINDDFNSPILIAHLFDLVKIVNEAENKKILITNNTLEQIKTIFSNFIFDILGLENEQNEQGNSANDRQKKLVDLLLEIRQNAKTEKNWAVADEIRNKLTEMNIHIKDTKDGFEWDFL